jgi:hypothetical protein
MSVPLISRPNILLTGALPRSCAADPGATMTFVAGGALKPIGGHILSHASATRIFLRKGAPVTHPSSLSLTPLTFERPIQVGRRSASQSLLTAQTSPNPKLRTSWMKVAGQMFDVR